MKNPNGYGTIIKLSGNRRRPYACRKTVGFNDKGYPIYKYISYHKTKREAIAALREYNADPYNLNQKTFAEVYELWIEHQNYSKAIRTRYDKAFERCESLHNDYMRDMTLPRIQGLFDEFVLTETQIKNIRTLLKAMIDYSIKRGLLPISAKGIMQLVESVPRLETNKTERTVFTRAEIDMLWSRKDEDTARIMLFYIYTGMRFSELFNRKPEDWHENFIEIPKAKTEAGVRIVPLSDKARSLLPLPEIPLYKSYNRHMKQYGSHNAHDTRHTFISLMTEAGVDPRLLKKIVGHATGDVTENVYTHISLEKMIEAVNLI